MSLTFEQEFAAIIAEAADKVCSVCGLQRLGHRPESQWLGYDDHDWSPRMATAEDIRAADALTREAYRRRTDK